MRTPFIMAAIAISCVSGFVSFGDINKESTIDNFEDNFVDTYGDSLALKGTPEDNWEESSESIATLENEASKAVAAGAPATGYCGETLAHARRRNGDANGAACYFPMRYNGKVYNKCITDGCGMMCGNKHWCYTTRTQGSNQPPQKWGKCTDNCISPPPTKHPTNHPTKHPTSHPTSRPTENPTKAPTSPTPVPTQYPTKSPTHAPIAPNTPTQAPTSQPTENPTKAPTPQPSRIPTTIPTRHPTVESKHHTQEETLALLHRRRRSGNVFHNSIHSVKNHFGSAASSNMQLPYAALLGAGCVMLLDLAFRH